MEGKEEEGAFGIMEFVFPSNNYAWQNPAFLKMANHLLADEK